MEGLLPGEYGGLLAGLVHKEAERILPIEVQSELGSSR